ncbi:diguanylate cyclase/phosphodiesterase (GGDEF & EAL domains) with PAS/PAC sensor(s) [hydrothermal vent metagenome]|uniref:Diguanylate cyclase/phosphodiesterase (GGDEF & EAL domains) with PAS/PAC sensor(S) n=1 Tax=hydrothermal vent metagenome TaxID=652676 RepID=A0A3B0W8H2_9ZZZZ
MSLQDNYGVFNVDTVLLDSVLNHSPSCIALKDLSGQFIWVNPCFCQVFGLTESKVIGRRASDILSSNIVDELAELDSVVLNQNKSVNKEVELLINGCSRFFVLVKFPWQTSDQQLCGIGCILTEITAQKVLEKSYGLAQKVIDNASEAVVFTDAKGLITDINDAYEKITGYQRSELIGRNPNVLKSGRHDRSFYQDMWIQIKTQGYWSGEVWDRRKSGEIYPKWLMINAMLDEKKSAVGYVGIFSDLSDQKEAEQKLKELSFYDPLTHLPNRVLFKDRLSVGISIAKRDKHQLAVLLIDLDRFKVVNDSLGHNAGDELLELISQRFLTLGRESDTVARLGGDEFAVLLPELNSPEDASVVAQNFIDALLKPFHLQGHNLNISASIGISVFPCDGVDVDGLVKRAELALYKAKEQGRNHYQYFSQELQDAVFDQLEMEDEMQYAILNQQFTLYYQPKISLATNKITGMEALVRWVHPEKGLIPPDKFIPLAEESGLIIPLGEWILQTACRETAEWVKKYDDSLVVAVNLSAKQFKADNLLETIQNTLKLYQLKPKNIELEITESCVMENVEGALQTMKDFRKHQLKLAIDDFGTGYSSLGYLKQFPMNTLKIDRSFVMDLTTDSDDAAIVEIVILLADKLGLDVVAEGVETDAQLNFLREQGCQYVQGYLLSRPLPADEFEQFLKKHL